MLFASARRRKVDDAVLATVPPGVFADVIMTAPAYHSSGLQASDTGGTHFGRPEIYMQSTEVHSLDGEQQPVDSMEPRPLG